MKWGATQRLIEKRGIQLERSLPEAHYQNLVERYVQTITKAVSTIIHSQSFLRANLWNYALFYVINRRNSTPSSKSGDKTPLQLVEGDDKKVDVRSINIYLLLVT